MGSRRSSHDVANDLHRTTDMILLDRMPRAHGGAGMTGAMILARRLIDGATVIRWIAKFGTLSGLVTKANKGRVAIEFGAMAAATAAHLSECAARTY